MSWGLTYRLPWPKLNVPAVQAAITHVLAQLPPRPRVSEVQVEAGRVRWFIQTFPDEERQWTVLGRDSVDKTFRRYEISDEEPLWVDIRFAHHPGDPALSVAPRTDFSFDTGDSGNGLAPGCVMHICGLLGTYFGVECEPN